MFLLLTVPLLTCGLLAQRTVLDGDTIHVYTNLLQIPVLILSQRLDLLPPMGEADFLVHLGKAAPFKPRAVRLEGSDPITLAVLLDGSQKDTLLPLLRDSLADMADKQLLPHDRIAVYAMDGCKLRRLSGLLPASDTTVRDSVKRAASFPPWDRYAHRAETCETPVGLWDSMNYLSRSLAREPGRRVVLAITNGIDAVSRTTPDMLRRNANFNGVTLFAVAERYKVPRLAPVAPRTVAGWELTSWLTAVTEGSGGLVVSTARNTLPSAFKRVIELLRGRYIVEFSRPDGLVAGTSTIEITCKQPRLFIRPAGTSLPTSDPFPRDPTVPHGTSPQLPTGTTASSENMPGG